MAALTNTQISVTYVGLLKTSANTVLSATAQQITDGSGNNTIMYLSTAGVGIGGSPTAGKELDVTGNVLITGDLQVDNINIDGNTISATSGVVTLQDGTIATTQSQSDNSTKVATTAYVDAAVTAEDLDFAGGSGTGSVDLDSQTFTIAGTSNEIETSASGQTLTIGLPDDVTVTGELTVSGTGQSSFGGQVTIPATPSASTDAASKGYVDSQVGANNELSEVLANGNTTGGTDIQVNGDNIIFGDSATIGTDDTLIFGAGNDLRIAHNGTDSVIRNYTGGLYIDQEVDDGDIIFRADDGSGGKVEYFKLDGSLVNGTTTLGAVNFPDKSKLFFGTNSDLRIYHDGSNSYIDESGTGLLKILTNGLEIKNATDTGYMAFFGATGAAELYYNTSKKFETTSAGVSVTGDADISSQVLVGGNDSIFAENNIRFKSSGGAFIDHNTTGQSISFRTSVSSSLDTTPLVLLGADATFAGTVEVDNMLKISIDDISTGENRGLQLYNENSAGQQWNITAGRAGQENTSFVVRDSSNNVDALIINEQTAGTTPLITVLDGGNTTFAKGHINFIAQSGDHARIFYTQGDGTTGDVWTQGFYQNSSFVASMEFFADSEAAGNGNIRFKTGGATTALTLDTSQNATFAGNIESNGTLIDLDSSTNAFINIDRGGTSNNASISWRNAGSSYFTAGIETTNNDLWSLLHTCGNGLYFNGATMTFGFGVSTPQTAITLPQGNSATNKISWYDSTPTFAASILCK